MRHKKTAKELKADEEQRQQEQAEKQQQAAQQETIINSISGKADALAYIMKNSVSAEFLSPEIKELMKKFDITQQELKERMNAKKEMV